MAIQSSGHMRLSTVLCACVVLICLAVLCCCLNGGGRKTLPEMEGSFFGMLLIDIEDEETAVSYHVQECGVYVLAVQEQSPAARAGISSGDRLVQLNGLSVTNTADLSAMQKMFISGQTVSLEMQPSSGMMPYTAVLSWNAE